MLDRGRRRRAAMGLATVLGIREAGFFIPHRHAPAARPWAGRAYGALGPVFEAASDRVADFLGAIETFGPALSAIGGAPPPAPRFEQDWFPRLDAAALYTLVRTTAPSRIVEVGSGHSTRFLARAVADGALPTLVTAIDPAPRADIAALPVGLERRPLQEADPAIVASLSAGDLLMVDSSHVLMPGTDVDIVLNHILPAAPAGLAVGFHDIFLPGPYPPVWPFTSYNEQSAVAPLLQGGYDIVFASAFALDAFAGRIAGGVLGTLPLRPGARESLLLLRKR